MLNFLVFFFFLVSIVYNEGLDRGWGFCLEVICDNNIIFDYVLLKLLFYNI